LTAPADGFGSRPIYQLFHREREETRDAIWHSIGGRSRTRRRPYLIQRVLSAPQSDSPHMSTHLPGTGADQTPVTEADLLEYFRAGAKPASAWRVGAEFEKFALARATGRQIGFDDGIEDVLHALVRRFGWEPHFEAGRLTILARGKATISVEPGGQLELSTSPAASLRELEAEFDTHLRELRTVTDAAQMAWIGCGVSPFSRIDEIPLNPRPRHRLMAAYLPTRSPTALHMMKATASTQSTFDYADEADAGRKFAVALTLAPVVNALFANSPMCAGVRTEFASFRANIWDRMDPDRSGLLEDLLAGEMTFARWIRHALDVPLLILAVGDSFEPAPGMTFRQFLDRGIAGRFPTRDDWGIHLSTLFTEARLKTFLEVRGADATPTPLAVPALWKGLLYDADALRAATELARNFAPDELRPLAEAVSRSGLRTRHRGKPLADWCREVVAVAEVGLRRQGEDVAYLDPLQAVLASGRSRGEDWPAGGSVADVLAFSEYPAGRTRGGA
jgi:glutamate--cysteine ligase